jgi:oligoribonuclease NrnB/cAMP/cGMP phosphodiesterase (DHH superfamily)
MPTLEELSQVKVIFVHASCADGLASAMVCSRAFSLMNSEPEIKFIQYRSKEHTDLKPESGQMFIDITPPLDRWVEWKSCDPIVLDHHITAKQVTEELGGIYGGPNDSGATLAFEHVLNLIIEKMDPSEKSSWEKFVHHIMTRDTWKDKDPVWQDAQAFASGIMFLGAEELIQRSRDGINIEEIQRIGQKVYDNTISKSKIVASNSYIDYWLKRGIKYKIGLYNTTEKNVSEIAHILQDKYECDLTIGFFLHYEENKANMIVSLRSNGSIDVAKLAEKFDGGGHTKAAGFNLRNSHEISASKLLNIVRNAFLDL